MAGLHLPCQLPPASSLCTCLICKNKWVSAYASSHFVPVTAPISLVIMRIPDPQRSGNGKTLLEQGRTCFLLLLLTLLYFWVRKTSWGSHFSIFSGPQGIYTVTPETWMPPSVTKRCELIPQRAQHWAWNLSGCWPCCWKNNNKKKKCLLQDCRPKEIKMLLIPAHPVLIAICSPSGIWSSDEIHHYQQRKYFFRWCKPAALAMPISAKLNTGHSGISNVR